MKEVKRGLETDVTPPQSLTFTGRLRSIAHAVFEFLTDVASPTFHPIAGQAKDVAAGAVLLTAIGAVIIGALVFGPHVVP